MIQGIGLRDPGKRTMSSPNCTNVKQCGTTLKNPRKYDIRKIATGKGDAWILVKECRRCHTECIPDTFEVHGMEDIK